MWRYIGFFGGSEDCESRNIGTLGSQPHRHFFYYEECLIYKNISETLDVRDFLIYKSKPCQNTTQKHSKYNEILRQFGFPNHSFLLRVLSMTILILLPVSLTMKLLGSYSPLPDLLLSQTHLLCLLLQKSLDYVFYIGS